ncbi:hypothetical protein [Staphylococcus saprophyticus]|nr:hypothetical protein [Staphylococcus saprophyticus]
MIIDINGQQVEVESVDIEVDHMEEVLIPLGKERKQDALKLLEALDEYDK